MHHMAFDCLVNEVFVHPVDKSTFYEYELYAQTILHSNLAAHLKEFIPV